MTRMLVSLLTLGSPDQLTGGYLYHQRVAELAGPHDAHVEFVPVRVTASPFKAAAGDVVVVDSIAAARVAPWKDGHRPLAAIVHQPPGGIDGARPRRVLQAALDRAFYRRCDLVIAASEALGAELTAPPHALPAARVQVVAPGCDGPPAPAGPPPDLRGGRPVAFVSVGNWMARKGTLELLDAFALLAQSQAVLHLAGRDDIQPRYAARVRARLAAPDLVERVVVHGAVSRSEIGRLYAGADAFVLASYVEPYGTVYGEALAAGLPVVGWRAGNLPNLVDDGRGGVMVEPGDVAGLARAMDRLATDREWLAELAGEAKRRGRALPRWTDTAEHLFGSLRELTSVR